MSADLRSPSAILGRRSGSWRKERQGVLGILHENVVHGRLAEPPRPHARHNLT